MYNIILLNSFEGSDKLEKENEADNSCYRFGGFYFVHGFRNSRACYLLSSHLQRNPLPHLWENNNSWKHGEHHQNRTHPVSHRVVARAEH